MSFFVSGWRSVAGGRTARFAAAAGGVLEVGELIYSDG
jgi:hypothetical protein